MRNYSHDAPCPKCGQKNISNSFVHSGDIIGDYISNGVAKHDLITRYCRNCGYRWEELPVDIESGMAEKDDD